MPHQLSLIILPLLKYRYLFIIFDLSQTSCMSSVRMLPAFIAGETSCEQGYISPDGEMESILSAATHPLYPTYFAIFSGTCRCKKLREQSVLRSSSGYFFLIEIRLLCRYNNCSLLGLSCCQRFLETGGLYLINTMRLKPDDKILASTVS